MTTKRSLSINVYGRVQGVGFRFYTNRMAKELNLDGFVRNMPDGSVYIEAEGSNDNIQQFMEWIKEGPSWARVDYVNIQEIPYQEYSGFLIK